jgi:quinolinate synthase
MGGGNGNPSGESPFQGTERPQVISLDSSVCVCTTMFRITPLHLLWALENLTEGRVVNQISVDERTRKYARTALRPHACFALASLRAC